MNKELDEAWTTICHYNDEIIHDMGSEYVENPLKEELDIVNNALLELKAISNSNPSEALGLIKRTCEIYADSLKQRNLIGYDIIEKQINEALDTIKQALLKAQEPKQYLKWEDLEFSFKDKYMKVKLNGNIYTLRYTRNALMEFPVAYLEFDNTEITIIDCKKQFFNDLHLERVE